MWPNGMPMGRGGPPGAPPGAPPPFPPMHPGMYPPMMPPQQFGMPPYGMPPMMPGMPMYRPPMPAPNLMQAPPKQQPVIKAPPALVSTPLFSGISLFVGKLPPDMKDEPLRGILEQCGPIAKWSRISKKFGFCEYVSPDSAARALRLLKDIKINGQALTIKVDEKDKKKLDEYKNTLVKPAEKNVKGSDNFEKDAEEEEKKKDSSALVVITKIIEDFESKVKETEKKDEGKDNEDTVDDMLKKQRAKTDASEEDSKRRGRDRERSRSRDRDRDRRERDRNRRDRRRRRDDDDDRDRYRRRRDREGREREREKRLEREKERLESRRRKRRENNVDEGGRKRTRRDGDDSSDSSDEPPPPPPPTAPDVEKTSGQQDSEKSLGFSLGKKAPKGPKRKKLKAPLKQNNIFGEEEGPKRMKLIPLDSDEELPPPGGLEEAETKSDNVSENKGGSKVPNKKIVKKPEEKLGAEPKIYNTPIDWGFVKMLDLVENNVRPWVRKRVKKFVGKEDKDLENFITALVSRKNPLAVEQEVSY
mmetsp:Transcript_22724/g.33885  ORF Transcript_22724/g.33885 Transcript_22724/m.33885 type:complete len:531 (-) Transcript_22724:260-1852(-)